MSNISTLTITGFLRAAFVFNKSLSVSFTVLITFYLLIEKGTSFNLKTQIKSIFCDSVIVFSAECTIGMVLGLIPLRHYGHKALWHYGNNAIR